MDRARAVEILKGARERIAHGWTQQAAARGENGGHIDARDPSAVRWCLTGALHAAADGCACPALLRFLGFTERGEIAPHYEILPWNDTPGRTQAEVLAKLDEAIVLAERAS